MLSAAVEPCVFCEIVAGRRPAHVVHETPGVVSFMDQFRQPSDPAHVLVIPRIHVENIYGVDDALGADLFASHALLARAVKRAFSTDGVTTWSSNELGANQEVPHFHLHVYPRRLGVAFPPPLQRPDAPVADEVLAASARRIREAVETLHHQDGRAEDEYAGPGGLRSIARGKGEFRRATLIRAPAQRVYDLIATAEGLDSWFTTGAMVEPWPDGRIVYRWKDWGPDSVTAESRGVVHEADPPRRFVFDWDAGDGQQVTAEFDIEPAVGGVVLRLREHGYEDSAAGAAARVRQSSGWGEAMTLLKFMAEHGLRY